eukprot:6464205-Amphidinium_carterae.3
MDEVDCFMHSVCRQGDWVVGIDANAVLAGACLPHLGEAVHSELETVPDSLARSMALTDAIDFLVSNLHGSAEVHRSGEDFISDHSVITFDACITVTQKLRHRLHLWVWRPNSAAYFKAAVTQTLDRHPPCSWEATQVMLSSLASSWRAPTSRSVFQMQLVPLLHARRLAAPELRAHYNKLLRLKMEELAAARLGSLQADAVAHKHVWKPKALLTPRNAIYGQTKEHITVMEQVNLVRSFWEDAFYNVTCRLTSWKRSISIFNAFIL